MLITSHVAEIVSVFEGGSLMTSHVAGNLVIDFILQASFVKTQTDIVVLMMYSTELSMYNNMTEI